MAMTRACLAAILAAANLIVVTPAYAQEPDAKQIAQERRQAEKDVPKLAEGTPTEAGNDGR